MRKLRKKIGFDQAKFAIDAVRCGDFAAAAAIGLTYYDKTYNFCFDTNNAPQKHILTIEKYDPSVTAQQLIDFANIYHL